VIASSMGLPYGQHPHPTQSGNQTVKDGDVIALSPTSGFEDRTRSLAHLDHVLETVQS